MAMSEWARKEVEIACKKENPDGDCGFDYGCSCYDSALRAFESLCEDIDKVVFNEPATIVLWKDGTKTVVKCGKGDIFDPEKGLAMAIAKKVLGNKGNYYEVFKKFITEDKPVSSKFIVGDRVVFDCLGDIHLGIIKEIELSRDRFVYIVECMDQNGITLTVRIDEGDLSYAPV